MNINPDMEKADIDLINSFLPEILFQEKQPGIKNKW